MTSQHICYRSDLLGSQVITRDTGKRLGIVSQLWVDIDRREVVALGLRDNLLSGILAEVPKYMLLNSIYQIGDVILVDDENAIIDFDVESYSSLIRCEVITETGELLGRVHSFRFDIDDGKLSSLIVSSLGIPQIPDQLVSTYELPVEEIVSSGPDRLIVFEGAEERLNQLSVGLLEKVGIGKPPWERDIEDEYLPPVARPENQLGTGAPIRTATAQPLQSATPASEGWDENDWDNAPQTREPVRLKRAEPARYEPASNWSEAVDQDDYDAEYEEEYEAEPVYAEPEPPRQKRAYMEVEAYEPQPEDYWADKEEPTYQAPKVNIPEKIKTPEYEEEEY